MAFKMRCPKCFGLDYSIERDNRTFGAVAQAFELVFHCRCGKQMFGETLLKEYDAQKKEFDTNGEALPRPTTRRAEDEVGANRRAMTPDEIGRRDEDSEEDEDARDDDDDSRPPPDKRWQQRMAEMTADSGDDDDDDDDDETPLPAPSRAVGARRSVAPPAEDEDETDGPGAAAEMRVEPPVAEAPKSPAKVNPPPPPSPAPSKEAPLPSVPPDADVEADEDGTDGDESEEDGEDGADGDSVICAWPGCTNHRRPNSKYCSRACSNKNARSRHKTRIKKPRGKKGGGSDIAA